MTRFTFSLFFIALLRLGIMTPVKYAVAEGEGNFEITKATANKIWRLNKTTGEISICTLAGERLQCTSSTDAIRPPVRTYEQQQVENERLAKKNRAKDMEFFDRALNAIRTLFEASLERED